MQRLPLTQTAHPAGPGLPAHRPCPGKDSPVQKVTPQVPAKTLWTALNRRGKENRRGMASGRGTASHRLVDATACVLAFSCATCSCAVCSIMSPFVRALGLLLGGISVGCPPLGPPGEPCTVPGLTKASASRRGTSLPTLRQRRSQDALPHPPGPILLPLGIGHLPTIIRTSPSSLWLDTYAMYG